MARRSVSRKGYKRARYSVENVGVNITTPEETTNRLHQAGTTIIPPTDVEGVRTVKHLTLSLSTSSTGTGNADVWWAIVFVPEGYNANPMFQGSTNLQGSIYEPNQFVMGCGYIDPEAGPIRITSRVARNLQSGDSVALVIGSRLAVVNYTGVLSYAIAYK